MFNRFHCKILFFLFLGVASWGFFAPNLDSGISLPHFDKVMHFLIFAWLTMFFDKGFAKPMLPTIGLLFAYGASVELIQGEWAGRQASLADLVADTVGVVFYFAAMKPIIDKHFRFLFR